MAAIFQIRRGTTNETLTDGELYLHKGSGSIQFGSGSSNVITLLPLNVPVSANINLIGNITASNAYFTGDVAISGNLFLGNQTTDTITATGEFTSNLIPNPTNTYSIGSTSKVWKEIHATSISGAIAATNGVVSGSSQITSILDSLNTFSGSQLTQNTTLATISGSLILTASANTISVTNLNLFSGSQLTQNTNLATISGSLILTASANTISVTNLNTFSGSQLSKDATLATLTASYDDRFTTLVTYTGSVETRFGTLATLTGSNSIRLTNLETTTASLNVSVTNLNTFSGSQLTQNSALATITGSLIDSASADRTSIASLNSYTSSLQQAITASGANLTINGNLTVKGTTTQIDSTTIQIGDNIIELNGTGIANGGLLVKDPTGGSTLSGSLLWDSTNDYWKGGTLGNESKLLRAGGDSVISASAQLTELNSFTSSQLTQNGALATISGSLISTASANTISLTNLNSFSSSQLTQNTTLATISGSLILTASANTISIININTITASLNTSVTNINSFTSSQLTQNTTLGSYTASVNQTTSSLNSYTASANAWSGTIDSRFTTLGTYTASVNQTTSSLNLYTASANTWSGTIDTRFTTLGTYTASVNQTTSSLNLYTASANVWSGTIDTRFTTLGTYTGSVNQTTSSLNSYTASISTSFGQFSSSYAADSASFDYRIDTLDPGNLSGNLLSIQETTASLNTFSASAKISITNLEAASSSYETNGRGIVSGSSQITYASISSIPSGIVSGAAQIPALLPSGVVSGSSQITYASISSIPSGIVSGSSQITYASISSIPSGIVSGSSQITYASISSIPSGIVSGSSQVLGGSGIVSGAAQIPALLPTGVVSGSSQVLGGSGVASGSYETTGRSIVSSSAQIVPLLPAGVVSGSTQVITSNAITLGTHTTGNYVATIAGTTNQITVAGSGLETAAITLSTPQDIHTSATPQFSSLGIGTAASGVGGEIRATGDIVAFYSSDERLKSNIQPIGDALDKVNQISGNVYDWKEGFENIHSHTGTDIGVIAQEIEKVLPQAVIDRENGYKAVNYEKIVPLLIEAIKELSAKVKELENK